MPDSNLIRLAVDTPGKGEDTLQSVPGAIEAGVAQIESVPSDVANIPRGQHLTAAMPAADLSAGLRAYFEITFATIFGQGHDGGLM